MTIYRPMRDGAFTPATAGNDDSGSITLGLEFLVTSACWLTHIAWYQGTSGATNTDTRTAALFTTTNGTSGTKVVADFTVAPSGTGWQAMTLPEPYELATSTIYRACVFHPNEGYTATGSFFLPGNPGGDANITAGPVQLVTQDASLSNQNSFNTAGTLTFPTAGFNGGNYWLDVTVDDEEPGGGGGTPAPGTWSRSLTMG